MSPEQARGRPADKRSDIWAFGCVLYEMLTGKRPFGGDDISETLAFVITKDPDWSALPADTPPNIRQLIRRCIEKNRHERIPDIGVARLEINDALKAPEDEPLLVDQNDKWPTSWSPDGRFILYGARAAGSGNSDLWILPTSTRSLRLSLDAMALDESRLAARKARIDGQVNEGRRVLVEPEVHMQKILSAMAIAVVCSVSVAAQWPKQEEAGVPRDAQGRPRLDAPPPRAADGKPDLSGVWRRTDRDPIPAVLAGLFDGGNQAAGRGGRGGRGAPAPVTEPAQPRPDPNSPPVAAFWDIGTNIPGGLPLTPWAAEIKKKRSATNSVDNPDANCLPLGIHPLHTHPDPRQIIQTPKLVVIAWEANYGLRFIHTDGRKLPPLGEPQPWWYGYSAGRWEGDTLVVETNNVRGAEMGPFDGWLDVDGSPHSNQVKFTERFRRPTFGKLEIDLTVEDPKAYTKPFTVRINQQLMVDDELIEFICNENQQFRRRVKVN